MSHADYLRGVMGPVPLKKTATRLQKEIRASKLDYDVIVGRGLSGTLVVPLLSIALHKPFAIVRKHISTHSYLKVESSIDLDDIKSYIVIDDLIGSGSTLKAIKEEMNELRMMGIFLYMSTRSNPWHGVPV